MATSDEIKRKALELSEKTDSNSISPKEVGGIMHDLASLGENAIRNGGTLGIRKVYTSVSVMEADKNPKDFWGNPMKKGNLVLIYDGTTTGLDNNKIYVYMNPGWEFATYLDAGYPTRQEFGSEVVGLGAKKKNKKTGKNLFDKSAVIIGLWVGYDGTINQYEGLSLSEYIPVLPNTEYYIQETNTGGASNVWFDKNINAISAAPKNGVCVSPGNAMYIRLSVDVKNIDTAMFFKGNSKSEYIPYTDNYDNEQIFNNIKNEISDLGSLLNSKTEATTEINKICNIKTGEITTNYTFSIQKLEIPDNVKKLVMLSYWGSNSRGDYDGAAFYDKNMNYIGCVQGILGEMWSVSLTEIPLGMIPSAAKYVVTTSSEFKDSVGYCEQRENVAKELGELKKQIKDIENDLEGDIKNYIEKNYTLPTYQDEALGKNLFNKNGEIYGDFVYADGNSSSGNSWDSVPVYTSGYFATTYPIAVEGGKELTVSPTTNDAIYIAEYDADGSFVKSTKSLSPYTIL